MDHSRGNNVLFKGSPPPSVLTRRKLRVRPAAEAEEDQCDNCEKGRQKETAGRKGDTHCLRVSYIAGGGQHYMKRRASPQGRK